MVPNIIYAIYCKEDKQVIWNARGSAYKNPLDIKRKIERLHKEHPDKTYRVLKYVLDMY